MHNPKKTHRNSYQQMLSAGSLHLLTLVITNALSFLLRIALPRAFGPEVLGRLYFAESFASLFFGFLPLGLSVFINRKIPPDHAFAKRALTPIIVVELANAALLSLLYVCALWVRGVDTETFHVALFIGLSTATSVFQRQILQRTFNATGEVRITAVSNVLCKIVLVVTCLTILQIKPSILWIALAHAAAELLAGLILLVSAWRRGFLTRSPDFTLLPSMLKVSLPFCLVSALSTLYAEGNTVLVSFFADDAEVGYYGVAAKLTGILMLIAPLIPVSITPALSQAVAQKDGSFELILAKVLRLALIGIFPVCMAMTFFGDVVVSTLFGEAFAPSARILSASAPVLSATIIATILGSSLTLVVSGTRMSLIYLASIPANLCVNALLIPIFLKNLGTGGAGVAAATADFVSEICMLASMRLLVRHPIPSAQTLACIPLIALPSVVAVWNYDALAEVEVRYRILMFCLSLLYGFLIGVFSVRDVKSAVRLLREWSSFWPLRS